MDKKGRPTLAVLAAGMGSRYGGLKQADPLSDKGHTLPEYNIYDALKVGFGKVVMLIRKDFEDEFKEKFGKKIEKGTLKFDAELDYAYQESVEDVQKTLPFRQKMWGTGHAALCFKDKIAEPAAVANADDYYGRGAFKALINFFKSDGFLKSDTVHAVVGYLLKNVVSPYGPVARGICEEKNGFLKTIVETKNIEVENDNIYYTKENNKYTLDNNTLTSMNLWGYHPSIFDLLEEEFNKFFESIKERNEPKEEFYLSDFTGNMIQTGRVRVKVLPTDEKWFGMTFKEDRPSVIRAINELTEKGVYPENLWE